MVAIYPVICHKIVANCHMVEYCKMMDSFHVSQNKMAAEDHMVWDCNMVAKYHVAFQVTEKHDTKCGVSRQNGNVGAGRKEKEPSDGLDGSG